MKKKVCKIELKYFTVNFINISGCFCVKYPGAHKILTLIKQLNRSNKLNK